MSVRVVIDPVKLADYVRSPSGAIFRRLAIVAQRVQDLAKERVGVSRDSFLGGAGLDTAAENPGGHLRDAIVKRVESTGDSFRILIGVFDPPELVTRAWVHHQGSRPHPIFPRNRKALTFFSPKLGMKVVVLKHPTRRAHVTQHTLWSGKDHVDHPGTRPNDFLTSSLRDAAAGLI